MGTRTKILTASVAVAVLALAMAAPVIAQDEQLTVLAYVDGEVDGPISHALATLATEYGDDARAVDATFVVNHGYRLEGSCVITVGRDADALTEFLQDRYGIGSTIAQGADRHETAILSARSVAAC